MTKPLALGGLLLLCTAATPPAALAHSPVLLADPNREVRAREPVAPRPKAETELKQEIGGNAPGADLAPDEELIVRGRYTSEPAR